MTQEKEQVLWEAIRNPKKAVLTSIGDGYTIVAGEKGLTYALEHNFNRMFCIQELIPYKDLHEFTRSQDAHSKYICFKDYPDGLKLPIEINHKGIYVKWFDGMQFVSYEDLADRCTWQDGWPCGTLGKHIETIF